MDVLLILLNGLILFIVQTLGLIVVATVLFVLVMWLWSKHSSYRNGIENTAPYIWFFL